MNGYLLDNNCVFRWWCGHPSIVARINALGDAPLRLSVITLGETEFGHSLTISTMPAQREAYIHWLSEQFPPARLLDVTRHTAFYYGDIRAELFRRYPPEGATENHPEMCFDKVSGKVLGIDENDLWIAAQAYERKLVLVSNDRMKAHSACKRRQVSF